MPLQIPAESIQRVVAYVVDPLMYFLISFGIFSFLANLSCRELDRILTHNTTEDGFSALTPTHTNLELSVDSLDEGAGHSEAAAGFRRLKEVIRLKKSSLVYGVDALAAVLYRCDQNLSARFPITLVLLMDEPNTDVYYAGLPAVLHSVLEQVEDNLFVQVPVAVKSLVLRDLFFHSDVDLLGFELLVERKQTLFKDLNDVDCQQLRVSVQLAD